MKIGNHSFWTGDHTTFTKLKYCCEYVHDDMREFSPCILVQGTVECWDPRSCSWAGELNLGNLEEAFSEK